MAGTGVTMLIDIKKNHSAVSLWFFFMADAVRSYSAKLFVVTFNVTSTFPRVALE